MSGYADLFVTGDTTASVASGFYSIGGESIGWRDPKPPVLEILEEDGTRIDVAKTLRELQDPDALWEKMYVHAKKVIVPCSYCGSHNAFSNATCVRCGAPMGEISD
jgi:hypothetical protein